MYFQYLWRHALVGQSADLACTDTDVERKCPLTPFRIEEQFFISYFPNVSCGSICGY